MPLQATSGAASYDGFGGGVAAVVPQYIEEVFSTYLYTGNGSTRTITNNIDLAGEGGMVWIKRRDGVTSHTLFDTEQGATNYLQSNAVDALSTNATMLTAFNANGFSLGADGNVNRNTNPFASWTFRKQPKFFDIVTYTGTGSNTTIGHALGSVPACIMVKRTDTTANWQVYHRSLANTEYLVLNDSAAKATGATRWNSTTPTSTVFSLGTDASVNASGGTYVAYIFAHNAGGFSLTGTDNVISCGTYTGNGSELNGTVVNLGYEPQFLLIKATNTVANWFLIDNMRGWGPPNLGTSSLLSPNLDSAETLTSNTVELNSTGFKLHSTSDDYNGSARTYIYIAIRRGPMKVPTSGTSVFGVSARTGTGANATVTGGQTDDAVLVKNRGSAVASLFSSRLTGTGYLVTSSTAAEVAAGVTILQANPWDVMDGVKVGTTSTITNASANTYINYLFKRAPSFMDVVCYTGTGSATTFSHNLQAVPELMVVKKRGAIGNWAVYAGDNTDFLLLNTTAATADDNTYWNDTSPTSTVFSVGTNANVNTSAATYVAYLFATLAGVSKVGSYTGNGSSQTINCGFTAGARYVLIKRTDSTSDWFVWDSARGIVAGNDPHFRVNLTNVESGTTDSLDTDSTGFIVNQVATDINITSATYIFWAIA